MNLSTAKFHIVKHFIRVECAVSIGVSQTIDRCSTQNHAEFSLCLDPLPGLPMTPARLDSTPVDRTLGKVVASHEKRLQRSLVLQAFAQSVEAMIVKKRFLQPLFGSQALPKSGDWGNTCYCHL